MATVRRSILNPKAPAYIPLPHTNNTPFHPPPFSPMPCHFYTPAPTVGSPPRENVTRRRRPYIPPWFVPPRLRNTGRGERGGFGSCSNEGSVNRRSAENDQRRSVCYDKWPSRNNGLKKHDVIPINWRQKYNTTSVMIKNIPYDYNREMLMQFLDEYCLLENQEARDSNGENIVFAYDFLYLPMDFKNKKSKGYAFVNFTDHRTVWNFFWTFNDKLNVFRGSTRSVKVVTAKIQGKEALAKRFKDTKFECESEGFLPVFFRPPRNGSGESVQMITLGKCKVPQLAYILKKP
ncbi:unnamed protein product [Withania somnifera]